MMVVMAHAREVKYAVNPGQGRKCEEVRNENPKKNALSLQIWPSVEGRSGLLLHFRVYARALTPTTHQFTHID
jgi:hypothetical protein